MKLKKWVVVFLLVAIVLSQFSVLFLNNFVYATENSVSGNFHYEQLGNEAKKIYQAMHKMYTEGILKTGTQGYDLVKNGFFTEDEVKAYENGNKTLTSAMNAARYAFYADYPEIFYVNFQKLSIRITKDANNEYHAYIGSGRFADYYTEGFTAQNQVEQAINEFNNCVNEIAQNAKNIEVEANKNKTVAQIKFVHNEIIYHTGYRLETDCTPGNEGFISTPYGALVKKEAVCEGYARAFKTILDKVGINSILVQGVHQNEGSAAVPHMWNYVEVEKQTNARTAEKVWYAVDATLDDPFLRRDVDREHPDFVPGMDITEGFENTKYCLVGAETMNREHVAIETVEAAGNYVFQYPALYVEDYGIDTVVNDNGLVIRYKQEGTQTEQYEAGDYYVSYNGKGFDGASKEGKYIITKSYYYLPGDEKWDVSPWAYLVPDVYAGGFLDYDDHVYITVPNSEYVEFAVTTLAPGDYKEDPTYLAYQGDESDFVAQSGKLYNPSGTYKGKPYIKSQTPAPTSDLSVGPTYHIDVTYTDNLVLANGATKAGYRMESTGNTGVEKSEITNFTFDGKNRVTFDLKFSQMYADDGAVYKIYLTGLVGKNSGKAPMEITYSAVNPISCATRMNAAKNWEVFGRPTLLETEDLSMNDWVTSDGSAVSDKLKSRIALVTTKTTKAETETMNDLMENKLGNQDLIKSETYNISLNVCRKYVVKTGHRLRISLGFPAGYGPDDAGVTFKAYHFMRDAAGNVTGVEEIPCVVTEYGLIITCDAFSPFAIAVVENDGTVPQEKSVVVSATEGGIIEGANREEGNIVTLAEGASKTLKVKPNAGYEIETLTVCGKQIAVANKEAMDVTVNYNDVKAENCIVSATFVAKTVAVAESERGETVVTPVVTTDPEVPVFETSLAQVDSAQRLYAGSEFEVMVRISNLASIENGIVILSGQLDYDRNVFEKLSLQGQNGWDVSINDDNLKFVADNKQNPYVTQDGNFLKIRFKVKEDIDVGSKPVKKTIMLKNIVASNAEIEPISNDAKLEVEIYPNKDEITSEKYLIEQETISKIAPKTTVKVFKQNVETYQNMIFTDKNGNVLGDDAVIGTGMRLQVGTTLNFTLIVTGDIDGTGEITVTDLAQLKLHYIEHTLLTGAALRAGDIDGNGEITVSDLAQVKLVLIGLREIK